MTVFEKFKQYIKENPAKRDNLADIAQSIGVDYQVLATTLQRAEKSGEMKVVRENAKKYKFKA